MRQPDEDVKKTMERLLRKIGEPDPDQMEQRIGSVARTVRPAVLESQGQMELARDRVRPYRQRTLAVAFAAIAVMVVVALSATVWKPVRPVSNESVMTLEDGSRVERSADAEVSVERAADGLRLRLNAGSIIVKAAKQAEGRHLYVETKDVTVSVLGTVFFVKADENGSRVAVIEGAVSVKQGIVETKLQPGEQMSSNSANPSNEELQELALQAEIGWSREAADYLARFHQALAQQLATRQSSPRPPSVPDKLEFEVASIRPCDENFQAPPGARGGGSNSLRMSRGRLDALCVDIATLIPWAYGPLAHSFGIVGRELDMTYGIGIANDTHVRGGPDWMRSEKYAISAVAPGPADGPTMQGPMLRALLEDRFKLKLRVESEELPAWELKVAKDGLKIKPAKPGSCIPMPRFTDEAGRRQFQESRGTQPLCISGFLSFPPNVKVTSVGETMKSLAARLNQMSRMGLTQTIAPHGPLSTTLGGLLVVDKTGIPAAEVFDFVLEIRMDLEPLMQWEQRGVPADRVGGPPGATVFKALESLGLTLERGQGAREFIVIDHIERPSGN